MEIIVIGGGPAGLTAAIFAARSGARVTVLEGMEKPGKKLLMTGNGRCNLTNLTIQGAQGYQSDCLKGVDAILRTFSYRETLSFFRELGLLTRVRQESLVYPYSEQAASVLDALLKEVRRLSIKLKCREKVLRVVPEKDRFLVKTSSWEYEASRVILAAGGCAVPATGSDGSGFSIARELSHSLIPAYPGLVPLTVKERVGKSMEGVRCQAQAALFVNGKECGKETGELQWTSYGISGILIFQLSRRAVREQALGKKVEIVLDLFPDYSEEELLTLLGCQTILETNSVPSYEGYLGGIFHKKVLNALLGSLSLKPGSPMTDEEVRKVLYLAKHLKLTITGSRSFDQAQISTGGIPLSEVDGSTLESKKVPHLYVCGELVNVDGPCGGFNLQWAFASGCLAGRSAAREEETL